MKRENINITADCNGRVSGEKFFFCQLEGERFVARDLDLGKDFFSSWKPMSMADGDVMDFDLTPGNKKPFNFDKADMDFNLDGDFGKISSFNMDMSDLDISPPLKKDGQPKEKPKESSNGKNKDKADHFSFAFDFDELDNFNFESSLPKKGSKNQKDKSKTESPPGRSECQDEDGSEHMKQIESMSTLEDDPRKPSRPGTTMDFDMDSFVGGGIDLEPTKETRPSNLANDDVVSSEHSADTHEVASDKAKSHPETTVASWESHKVGQSEKSVSEESVELEACTGNITVQDWSPDSLSNNEPTKANLSEVQDEVDSVNANAIASSEKQDVNVISVDSSSCHYKQTISENSEKSNGEKGKAGVEDHVINSSERIGPVQVKSFVENSCTTSAGSDILHDTPNGRENKKPASEIHKLPLVSQPSQPTDLLEKETEKGREPLASCLKSFIQSEKPGCPVPEVASAHSTISSESSKKMGFTQLTLFEGKRDRAQNDKKLVSLPMQYSKTELPQIQRQESGMAIKISREVRNDNGLDSGQKMNVSSTTQNKDSTKSKHVLGHRETSMKGLDTLSSCASFSLEVNAIAAQSSGNPTTLAAIPLSKNIPLRQESGMALKISREVCNAEGLDNGKKSTTQNEDTAKSKSVQRQRETSIKDLDTLRSSRASFSLEVSNLAAKNSGNPTTLATIPTSKNTPAEGLKISSIEPVRKTPDLSRLKLQGLNFDSTKSPPIRKDIKPVGNIGPLRKTPSPIAHFPNSQKQTPPALSTKRKTLEEDAANIIGLHPSKRLMQSPTASRIVGDTSVNVLDKKVLYHSNMGNKSIKSTVVKSPVSTFHTPHAVKNKGANMSFSIESNNNIKQAEAYAKELDNLCNILKKKHDEAKELLVQAVVNSNKLLMLNNPRLDEKIRSTQNIFARLSLNSIHG